MTESTFLFWQRLLLVICAMFAVQSVSWMIIGSFDPFGFYDYWMAHSLFGTDKLTEEARKTFAFVLIPFGATTAAYFALVFLVVKNAFPKRERWAYRAVIATILIWFSLDTLFCLWAKAYFNILIVNIPCIVFGGIPLIALRGQFTKTV